MIKLTTIALLLGIALASSASADMKRLENSELQLELHKIKYSNVYASNDLFAADGFDSPDNIANGSAASPATAEGKRSPTKAFLMSALIPGLGQAYNKNYIKAGSFFAVDVISLLINRNLNSQGDDLRTEFRAYNRDYWSRDRYEEYVTYFNDTLRFASHHLPDTETQQYFEMTGKYDQFSWGWDDATFNGLTFDSLVALGQLREPSEPDETVPSSPRRLLYETMRDNSNQKYKSARRMASIALVNHLIAGLEAFFDARRHNRKVGRASDGFGAEWNVKADVRSFRAKQDTPFMQLSLKF